MRRAGRVLALGAGAVVLMGLGGHVGPDPAPPGPLPAGGLVVGLQDDQLPVATPARRAEGLARLAASGVRLTRLDVLWNDVAPRRPARPGDHRDPAYAWARYDAILRGLEARGIEAIVTIYRTPGWAADPRWRAATDGADPVQRAPAPAVHEAFMGALAARYSGAAADAAGRALPRVRMFEPWNEPNLSTFLAPQWTRDDATEVGWRARSPAIYADLLARAYRAVKAAQPDALVIGVTAGSTSGETPSPTGLGSVGIEAFVRGLAALGPPMDAYSQHLYPAAAPREPSAALASFARLGDLVALYDELRPGLPLLVTELGYLTRAPSFDPGRPVVGEAAQARRLREAFAALAAEPRVRAAVWFNLQDNPGWPSGLLRYPGGAPKAAWDAFLATLVP